MGGDGLESLKPHPGLIHGGPAMKKRGLAGMATQLGSLGQNLIAAGAMTTAAAMLYRSTDDEEKPEVESVAYVLGDWARAEADSMVLLPADAGKSRYMAVSFLDYRRNFWLPVRKVIGAAWNRMHSSLPVDEQEGSSRGSPRRLLRAVGDFARGSLNRTCGCGAVSGDHAQSGSAEGRSRRRRIRSIALWLGCGTSRRARCRGR